MVDCECLQGCPFFNDKMADKPALAEIYKKQYCLGDSTNCARHHVFLALGKPKVPADLYPNQMKRAERIVANQPREA